MVVRRAVFFIVWSYYPSPPLLDSSPRWNDETRGESLPRIGLSRIGVRDMLSYRSPMPSAAGTPRYENWVHWLIEGFRCRLCPPTPPLAGDKPQPYISPSTLGCRC